jgi:PucR family transcriptional regulator, purine catabolism regulatory protein
VSAAPTVRDLVAGEPLAGARLLGGASGLDAPVRAVVVAQRVDRAAPEPGAAVLLVAAETSLDADVALRHAADRGAALVLLPEGVPGPSTARIADRLAIPAIVHGADDPYALARALDTLVRAPRLAAAELALAAARAVRLAGAEPQRAVPALAAALALPVAIVDAEGAEIAPASPGSPPALADGLLAAVPRTLPDAASGGLLVSAPILLAAAPEAWLIAGPARLGPGRAEAVLEALEVAAAGLAGAFARRRLALERDARFRAGLLAELLALSGPPPPQLAERLVAAGWRTAGWHVALHLSAPGADEARIAAATARVERLLAEHGFDGPVAPASDGWSTWVTSEGEPVAAGYRALVRAARALVSAAAPQLVLHGGVGAPRAGVRGLGQTVAEARQASVLAAGDRPAVEHVGEQDGRRLLLGSLGSPSFRAYAESLLAPLTDGAEPALLQTLEAYLEHESSAASTAAALGVHRNTVAQRVRRAEQLLGVSLAQVDERLTLQLACRVLRS